MPTGPSTSTEPYLVAYEPNVHFTSILTAGDTIANTENTVVNPYNFVGVPDGLGAYDNNDGTITVLVNHELGAAAGIVREHGATGAFVSQLVIDKETLEVVSAKDAINTVELWNDVTKTFDATDGVAFTRFCSGDLAPITAFFNQASNLGSIDHIYMTGEEAGAEGRAFGIVTTGADAGTAFELAYAGRFSWENAIASPFAQNKTIVIGTDDTSTPGGEVYVYVGDKTNTGNAVEKAGLVGGDLYGIDVGNVVDESNGSIPSGAFTLVKLGTDGDVSAQTGAQIEADSTAAGVTHFLRPEDCAWDPTDPNTFYFVTTNGFNNPSRLYKATFTDITHPENGGTITAVLDGTEGQQMMDNITVNAQGKVIIEEDVGNNAHLGKVWIYDPVTDTLSQIANHDPALFLSGAPDFITQDEEASGVIDVTYLLGDDDTKAYLTSDQIHNSVGGEIVEGGQLQVMYVETPVSGGADSDVINGDQNDNTLRGFDGDDEIHGGSGNDTLRGDVGNDSIFGGDGNDYLRGGDGDDALDGGAGDDTLLGDTGVNTLEGGDGNDKIYGNSDIDTALGGNGDDLIYGQAGDDSLDGGAGADFIRGGDDIDFILGGDDNDKLLGDGGDDTVDGGNGADTIYGNLGDDVLIGGAGDDIVRGGDGSDSITGGDGADRLVGDAGNDIIDGGAGLDVINGNAGQDTIVFSVIGDIVGDRVLGFTQAEGDQIDLGAIDAITGGADDAFTLVGAFSNTAGELISTLVSGSIFEVQGDIDGDGAADFSFFTTVVGGGPLVATDFIL